MPFAGKHQVQSLDPALIKVTGRSGDVRWDELFNKGVRESFLHVNCEVPERVLRDWGVDRAHVRFVPGRAPRVTVENVGLKFCIHHAPVLIGMTIVVHLTALYKPPHGLLQHLGIKKHKEASSREQELFVARVAITGSGPPPGELPDSWRTARSGFLKRKMVELGYHIPS